VGGPPEAPPRHHRRLRPAEGSARVSAGKTQLALTFRRSNSTYRRMAVSAHLQGIVILEAIVTRTERSPTSVLRSVNPLPDREALAAVRQRRYCRWC
jgi:hypothetical protein